MAVVVVAMTKQLPLVLGMVLGTHLQVVVMAMATEAAPLVEEAAAAAAPTPPVAAVVAVAGAADVAGLQVAAARQVVVVVVAVVVVVVAMVVVVVPLAPEATPLGGEADAAAAPIEEDCPRLLSWEPP